MKKSFLILFLILSVSLAYGGNIMNGDKTSATKMITGKVVDKKSGEELAGVEIKISDKTIYTDLNGNFSANVNTESAEAIIKFVSYNDTKVNIDPHTYNAIVVELESK